MTVPNILSLIRIILVPVFLYLAFTGSSSYLVATILLISGLTDLLDGYIARKLGQVSRLGTLLDPLADKLTMIAVLWALVALELIPVWIALVILTKELGMIIGAYVLLARKKQVISARKLGKAATVVLYAGVILAILEVSIASAVLVTGVIISLLAALDYLRQLL